jgi:hypothetical protein
VTKNERLENASGTTHRLLTVVVGLILTLLGLALTVGPAAQ